MEVIRGHLGCPLSGGCPLFGGSAIGGSTVIVTVKIMIEITGICYIIGSEGGSISGLILYCPTGVHVNWLHLHIT